MQDWVQVAQREEQHRRALEAQLEAQQAASGGAPPTPTKQQSNDAAAREVAQLQAQLTTVKADAESKLGSLRAELEGQQAAASQNRAEMESLRARHAAAESEIVKLRTPTKKPEPEEPAKAPQEAAKDSPAIEALTQEVEILKRLFLASTAPPTSPSQPTDAAKPSSSAVVAAPIPSPCRVIASPRPVRGSPHSVGGAGGAAARASANGRHMQALNQQIASWVTSSLESNPDADMTEQLQDYISHVRGWQEVHTKWFAAPTAQ